MYDIAVISETLGKVSVSTTFAHSWLVSVSTSSKLFGQEDSQPLSKFHISKSLSLEIFCFLSLADTLSTYYMDYQ